MLNTEEEKLGKALQSKRIKEAPIEELKATLLFVYTLIGLRAENYPSGLDKDFIHAYIQENYGGHTCDEIRLAFTMAIQGKLDLESNEVRVYENFNVFYFSTIMNAYRKWSTQAIVHVPKVTTVKELPPAKVSDAEFLEAVMKVYVISKDFKQIPELAYKILEPQMNLSKEDKQRIWQRVHEITRDGDMQELCRQYAVKEYFDKLLNEAK